MADSTGYCPIDDYGFIGDMHTSALVSKSGSIDFMCWPVFDSPSVFCRLLDKTKGGYFSISAHPEGKIPNKQKYVPCTNILETRWIQKDGAVHVIDFFPVSGKKQSIPEGILSGKCPSCERSEIKDNVPHHHSAVIRKVECVRGQLDMAVELFPAFNYARDEHEVIAYPSDDFNPRQTQSLIFKSATERLRVDIHADVSDGKKSSLPALNLELQHKDGLKGRGLFAKLSLSAGQSVTFIVHSDEGAAPKGNVGLSISRLETETLDFWSSWTRQCTYRGHYRELIVRSLLILKLLTYKPTGAIVAAPTFSLPEDVGGSRNWDYRYSWIRDTAFTLYVFLKNGYTEEAEAYISFIFNFVLPSARELGDKEQFLPIILTIRGESEIPETELQHFEGYRGSGPVRIGNAAAFHTQHDIYGALFDSIYLYNKHAGPISYDQWVEIRRIVNHITNLHKQPDMSIWEVRGEKQHFVYSKIMLWVTFDRAIRLAEKRSNLPCPEITVWRATRDAIYEEVMTRGYNMDGGFFCMSYENRNVVDASLLIAPLVFFIAPDDPRFLSTMDKIMQTPENGGLTVAKLVLRYDHAIAHDGIGSEEGAFIMVTFWLVEAMGRASMSRHRIEQYPHLQEMRQNAFTYFDNVLLFSNHLGMFSEEVNRSGEQMGNTPQAFSHLACISAAMNLERHAYITQMLTTADGQPCIDWHASRMTGHLSHALSLEFIDESCHLADYYGHDILDVGQDQPAIFPSQPSTNPQPYQLSYPEGKHLATPIENKSISRKQGDRPKEPVVASGYASPLTSTSSLNFPIGTNSQRQGLPRSIWSHKDIQEACLMRYFVEELAQWFDTCDASRHFTVYIPYRAPDCPALLYAILSVSARHLSRSQQTKANEVVFSGKKLPYLGGETALEYQNLCITQLMKLSGDSTEVMDENLLAAAVILRFYEEVDAPVAVVDGETYIRGTQVFLDAQSASAIRAGGVQLAAFWVGIRQEFHTGFLKQRPFQLGLDCCSGSIFKSLSPAYDCTWANRVILHCAEILIYCYGEENQTVNKYKELWGYNEAWQVLTPATFNPIHCEQPDRSKGEVFPALWYLDDCVVIGIQHWHIAKILLAVFDPTIPRMGPSRRVLVARREAQIKENVFRLCGIALSNQTAPALITACMGVSMCGDRATDRLEQEALLDILVKTEKTHSLPTTKAQNDLQEAWGWTVSTEASQVS